MDRIKTLFIKYKSLILYIFFGGLTTLVNWIVYFALTRLGLAQLVVANVIAWALSVLFAYITNKIFVFESKTNNLSAFVKELLSFVGARVLSGILDTVFMIVLVNLLTLNDIISKVIVGIIVIVVNYVLSKLFVFKGTKKEENDG